MRGDLAAGEFSSPYFNFFPLLRTILIAGDWVGVLTLGSTSRRMLDCITAGLP